MWQDWVMATCSAGFAVALVPQVIKGFCDRIGYLTLPTAALTTGAIVAISVSKFSMDLTISGIMDAVVGAMWFVLLVQRCFYGPAKRTEYD